MSSRPAAAARTPALRWLGGTCCLVRQVAWLCRRGRVPYTGHASNYVYPVLWCVSVGVQATTSTRSAPSPAMCPFVDASSLVSSAAGQQLHTTQHLISMRTAAELPAADLGNVQQWVQARSSGAEQQVLQLLRRASSVPTAARLAAAGSSFRQLRSNSWLHAGC